ncbi:MAG: RNA polymerase factor sigma-54 [Cytophagales bacterium]|nr:RNA polymerase factor sigma-54 [Cytophagales bacterium]
MQKSSLIQNLSLSQKLSPQQIQFIKLLQVPTMELEARIEEELEVNPALEEGADMEEDNHVQEDSFEGEDKEREKEEDINLDDYLKHDDVAGYKMQGDGASSDEEDKDLPIVSGTSLHDTLISQVGFLRLNAHKELIAKQLVGSIESDGYIRRKLDAIVNDLAFGQNVETDLDEVEEILYKIHSFEPAGIGARDLQECLVLQLDRKDDLDEEVIVARKVISDCFEEFTKKHYSKIIKKLGIDEDMLKNAITIITKLNPKPGSAANTSINRVQYVVPDFILSTENDKIHVALNARNAPELRVSRSYSDMFDTYAKSDKKDKKMKETVSFVKQKLDAAKWFIDAIKQRQQTLLRTMNAIVQHQYDFFLDGDESMLKPMILKDIAEEIEMDISTISRVANSKSVQTEFGTYPLKYFFSESLTTESGEDVSSREVKHALKQVIAEESKQKPLSDDKIVKELKEKGYTIARRTVAKYREQLGIPVARLRKEL